MLNKAVKPEKKHQVGVSLKKILKSDTVEDDAWPR